MDCDALVEPEYPSVFTIHVSIFHLESWRFTAIQRKLFWTTDRLLHEGVTYRLGHRKE